MHDACDRNGQQSQADGSSAGKEISEAVFHVDALTGFERTIPIVPGAGLRRPERPLRKPNRHTDTHQIKVLPVPALIVRLRRRAFDLGQLPERLAAQFDHPRR